MHIRFTLLNVKTMKAHKFILASFGLLCLVSSALCWDEEELEIFDVVEEVNENFYSVMGIEQVPCVSLLLSFVRKKILSFFLSLLQDATTTEVRKAYRSLSKILHPDKNDAADAEVKFRQVILTKFKAFSNKRSRPFVAFVLNSS